MDLKNELIDVIADSCHYDAFDTANQIMKLLSKYKLISCSSCKFNKVNCGRICDMCKNYGSYESDKI